MASTPRPPDSGSRGFVPPHLAYRGSMSDRARKRADRIHEQIDITQVLVSYGYAVHAGYGGEEQFPCDLHGDGHDNRPSARVYPDSNSWYCFACDRTRDAIDTVQEKEGKDFWAAVRALEERYGLPPLPYEDEGEQARNPAAGVRDAVKAAVDPKRTYAEERERTRKFLDGLTTDRELPLDLVLKLWEAYDKVNHLVDKELVPEERAKQALAEIRGKAMEALRG